MIKRKRFSEGLTGYVCHSWLQMRKMRVHFRIMRGRAGHFAVTLWHVPARTGIGCWFPHLGKVLPHHTAGAVIRTAAGSVHFISFHEQNLSFLVYIILYDQSLKWCCSEIQKSFPECGRWICEDTAYILPRKPAADKECSCSRLHLPVR